MRPPTTLDLAHALRFLTVTLAGLSVLLLLVVVTLLANAAPPPYQDPSGASMLLLIDGDGVPENGFDTWISHPEFFRFRESGEFQYQVQELNSAGEWVTTGAGTLTASIGAGPPGDAPRYHPTTN